jgi:hypothetical protein
MTAPPYTIAGVRRFTYATRMSEADLLACVTECGKWLGWKVYHTRFSLGSSRGFPDVCLVNRRQQRVLFVELKSSRGKFTPEQAAWICDLQECPGVETYIWTPQQWRDGTVERILSGEGAPGA